MRDNFLDTYRDFGVNFLARSLSFVYQVSNKNDSDFVFNKPKAFAFSWVCGFNSTEKRRRFFSVAANENDFCIFNRNSFG